MTSKRNTLSILKKLYREIKLTTKNKPLSENQVYQYVTEQGRKHQITGAKHCKERDELLHTADTYRCLLNSVRRYEELINIYQGKERTIEESANIVGLKLPKLYDPKN